MTQESYTIYDTPEVTNMANTPDNPKGHKETLSIRFIARQPMTESGFKMFGHLMRRHIAKSKYTFGSNMLCIPNLPYQVLQTNQALGEFCCQYFGENTIYVYAYGSARTPTHVGLKCIAKVEIQDSENRKFKVDTIIKSNKTGKRISRIHRFWFRKGK